MRSINRHPQHKRSRSLRARDYEREVNDLIVKGQLTAAERLARRHIKERHSAAPGWKALGVVLQKLGREEEALCAKEEAVRLAPNDEEARCNLGNAYRTRKELTKAENCYRVALEINPAYLNARLNLGATLIELGQLHDAKEIFQTAIALNERNGTAHKNLGCVLRELGRLECATKSFQKAIELDVTDSAAYGQLSGTLLDLGRDKEAEKVLREAVELRPDLAGNWLNFGNFNLRLGHVSIAETQLQESTRLCPLNANAYLSLGLAQKKLGKLFESEIALRRGIECNSNIPELYNNLGVVLAETGRYHEAENKYRRALELRPGYAAAQLNMASVYQHTNRVGEAVTAYENGLKLNPKCLASLVNLGAIHRLKGDLKLSEKYFRAAILANPCFAPAYNNLGIALSDLGNIDEANNCFRQALRLSGEYLSQNNENSNFSEALAHSNIIMNMTYSNAYSSADVRREAELFGNIMTRRASNKFTRWNTWDGVRKLRVGFVSGDFRRHPVAFFLESAIRQLNRERFEIFAYSTGTQIDDVTNQLRSLFDNWISLTKFDDRSAARVIHEHEIDILIDLSGHTGSNRLGIFSFKPALTQISWLGYWSTTGVPEINYVVSDPITTPVDAEAEFSEKILRMPSTRFCFTPPELSAQIAELPAISSGAITFGCFNNAKKIGDDVVDLWAAILSDIPESKLYLKSSQFNEPSFVERMRLRFENRRISYERLMLEGSSPRKEYLNAYNKIDITLDTFPFSGATTTVESLWMGVPTLTMPGSTNVSRQSASMMAAVGLKDWIASSEDEYLTKARSFSRDTRYMSALRSTLRETLRESPLLNAKKFAVDFEHLICSAHQERINLSPKVTLISN